MLKKAAIYCVNLVLLLVSQVHAELNVVTINAEWLWSPHDERVDGGKFNQGDMSPEAYAQEVNFYADMINKYAVHVAALSEIENKSVADDIARRLGTGWRAYFVQGRDTATGQDVALLSNLPYVEDSETAFGFPSGQLPGQKKQKRLSKVVGARFRHPDSGKIIGVVTAHFLSKRNDSAKKAANRLRQAYALRKAVEALQIDGEGLVVLGDFNDVRRSPVIQVLGQGLSNAEQNCQNVKGSLPDWSIDYIFYEGLECAVYRRIDLKKFSDHQAVFASFK